MKTHKKFKDILQNEFEQKKEKNKKDAEDRQIPQKREKRKSIPEGEAMKEVKYGNQGRGDTYIELET